jgi:cytochrome c oxidase assembly protein subunit 15
MDLAGFKVIYFWEWSHRQLGRIIGLVYAIPLLYFIISNKIQKGKLINFLAILFLICTQGFIGWWMVSSGLINDRVDVSQYRLATHLGVAFVILACLFWLWRNQRESWPDNSGNKNLIWLTSILSLLVYLQIILGAFVAGLKAGRTYNTWPLMDGDFIPKGYMSLNPYWRNIFENIGAVQFNHRTLAYIIIFFTICVFIAARNNQRLRRALLGFKILLVVQVLLGILVLITGDALWLALTHQFSAIILWLSIVNVTRLARFN